MPSTVLGLLVLVGALGPGYLFVRLIESLDPRPSHSPLSEAVEMAVIGSAATAISLISVVGVGDALNWLDTRDLTKHGLDVLAQDPWRWLAAFAAVVALSYWLAWRAAEFTKKRFASDFKHKPGSTAWNQAFEKLLPDRHIAVGTVYLRNRTAFTGQIRAWSPHLGESRELMISGPPSMQLPGGGKPVLLDDEFLLLREEDILYITVKHHPTRQAAGAESTATAPPRRRSPSRA